MKNYSEPHEFDIENCSAVIDMVMLNNNAAANEMKWRKYTSRNFDGD